MDNNRQVKHGTPIHTQPSLCSSCRHATKVKGLAESQRFIICDELPSNHDLIKMTVIECSKYDDRSKPTLRAMEQVAWKLATDRKGHKIGFLAPAEFRKRVKAKEVEENPSVYDPVSDETIYSD